MIAWWVWCGWALGWALLWRLPRLEARSGDLDEPHRTSIIIPARNEADRLPALLASLARQHRPPDQVIVVDDASSDGTGSTARSHPGVEVIESPPVPLGWAGKPWACATGARAAHGDVLIFLDADVELAPAAIGALVGSWRHEGGLLSVQPHHHIRRPVEALSLPFNVVSMMGLGIGSLAPPSREWGAAGPCLVTGRQDYERVGGHSAVAGEVAEDLALAELYATEGLEVTCLAGRDTVRYRMYRDAGALVEGWSKNLATGAGRTPLVRSLAVAVWITALLVMVWSLRFPPGITDQPAAWGLTYAAGAGQMALLGRQVGRFGPAGLVWPALVVVFVAVFARSVVNTVLHREVRWSGRPLAVDRRRRRPAPSPPPVTDAGGR